MRKSSPLPKEKWQMEESYTKKERGMTLWEGKVRTSFDGRSSIQERNDLEESDDGLGDRGSDNRPRVSSDWRPREATGGNSSRANKANDSIGTNSSVRANSSFGANRANDSISAGGSLRANSSYDANKANESLGSNRANDSMGANKASELRESDRLSSVFAVIRASDSIGRGEETANEKRTTSLAGKETANIKLFPSGIHALDGKEEKFFAGEEVPLASIKEEPREIKLWPNGLHATEKPTRVEMVMPFSQSSRPASLTAFSPETANSARDRQATANQEKERNAETADRFGREIISVASNIWDSPVRANETNWSRPVSANKANEVNSGRVSEKQSPRSRTESPEERRSVRVIRETVSWSRPASPSVKLNASMDEGEIVERASKASKRERDSSANTASANNSARDANRYVNDPRANSANAFSSNAVNVGTANTANLWSGNISNVGNTKAAIVWNANAANIGNANAATPGSATAAINITKRDSSTQFEETEEDFVWPRRASRANFLIENEKFWSKINNVKKLISPSESPSPSISSPSLSLFAASPPAIPPVFDAPSLFSPSKAPANPATTVAANLANMSLFTDLGAVYVKENPSLNIGRRASVADIANTFSASTASNIPLVHNDSRSSFANNLRTYRFANIAANNSNRPSFANDPHVSTNYISPATDATIPLAQNSFVNDLKAPTSHVSVANNANFPTGRASYANNANYSGNRVSIANNVNNNLYANIARPSREQRGRRASGNDILSLDKALPGFRPSGTQPVKPSPTYSLPPLSFGEQMQRSIPSIQQGGPVGGRRGEERKGEERTSRVSVPIPSYNGQDRNPIFSFPALPLKANARSSQKTSLPPVSSGKRNSFSYNSGERRPSWESANGRTSWESANNRYSYDIANVRASWETAADLSARPYWETPIETSAEIKRPYWETKKMEYVAREERISHPPCAREGLEISPFTHKKSFVVLDSPSDNTPKLNFTSMPKLK